MQVGFSMLEVGSVQKSSTRNVLVGIKEKETGIFLTYIMSADTHTHTVILPLHVFSCS